MDISWNAQDVLNITVGFFFLFCTVQDYEFNNSFSRLQETVTSLLNILSVLAVDILRFESNIQYIDTVSVKMRT